MDWLVLLRTISKTEPCLPTIFALAFAFNKCLIISIFPERIELCKHVSPSLRKILEK